MGSQIQKNIKTSVKELIAAYVFLEEFHNLKSYNQAFNPFWVDFVSGIR